MSNSRAAAQRMRDKASPVDHAANRIAAQLASPRTPARDAHWSADARLHSGAAPASARTSLPAHASAGAAAAPTAPWGRRASPLSPPPAAAAIGQGARQAGQWPGHPPGSAGGSAAHPLFEIEAFLAGGTAAGSHSGGPGAAAPPALDAGDRRSSALEGSARAAETPRRIGRRSSVARDGSAGRRRTSASGRPQQGVRRAGRGNGTKIGRQRPNTGGYQLTTRSIMTSLRPPSADGRSPRGGQAAGSPGGTAARGGGRGHGHSDSDSDSDASLYRAEAELESELSAIRARGGPAPVAHISSGSAGDGSAKVAASHRLRSEAGASAGGEVSSAELDSKVQANRRAAAQLRLEAEERRASALHAVKRFTEAVAAVDEEVRRVTGVNQVDIISDATDSLRETTARSSSGQVKTQSRAGRIAIANRKWEDAADRGRGAAGGRAGNNDDDDDYDDDDDDDDDGIDGGGGRGAARGKAGAAAGTAGAQLLAAEGAALEVAECLERAQGGRLRRMRAGAAGAARAGVDAGSTMGAAVCSCIERAVAALQGRRYVALPSAGGGAEESPTLTDEDEPSGRHGRPARASRAGTDDAV